MALAALKNVVQSWRNFIARIQACCQSVYNHRFALLAIVIFCLVCRFVPSVFSYVISCAPILICTAVLLQILLSLGGSSNEQAEEKTVHDISLNDRYAEKQKAFTSDSRLKRRNNIRERALARSGFCDIGKASSSKDKKVAFSSLPGIPLPRDHQARRKITLGDQVREIPRKSSSNIIKERDDSDDAEDCSFASDRAECSSPDSPPTDVLPVIDEYNPLLESKPPQIPVASSPYDSDAVLESSDRSMDGSNDSETENQEETEEKEEHGTKPFVTWTEDDTKNLMDLGTSELERNQRLESLIAKRRARRCVSSVIERNLIDFDSNPPVQAPYIRPVKNNPFDASYNSSENDGLPPVPGSAPSVLVPRGNPFDLPYDPQEEKPNLKEDSFQQEFTSVFCRHESFNYSSSSYMGGLNHDRYNTKYTPYVGVDGMVSNGNENSGSSVQLREKRHSIFEQLPPIDRKNHKKQMERVLSLGVYPSYVAQERIIPEMSFFKPYNEVKIDANVNKIDTKTLDEGITDDFVAPEVVKEKYSKTSISSAPETKEEVVHVEHSQHPEQASTSETKDEVSEQASTSESDDEAVELKNEEFQSNNFEPVLENDFDYQRGDSKEAPLSSEDFDHHSQVTEGVDDVHIKEPVYDSSPTAVEKRTIDEYLIYPHKSQNLIHTASVDSDMQVEVSEAGSPRESLDRYTYADGESSSYDGNGKNAIVSSDDAVEEKELRPIEATEKGEYDAVVFETPRAEPVPRDLASDHLEPTVGAEQTVNDTDSNSYPVNEAMVNDAVTFETPRAESVPRNLVSDHLDPTVVAERKVNDSDSNSYPVNESIVNDAVIFETPIAEPVPRNHVSDQLEPTVVSEQTVHDSGSNLYPVNEEMIVNDRVDNATPSSAEPEVPEVHQQGTVVDSTTPSPLTDLNKGEPLQEEMSNIPSDSHNSEESQEASLKYAIEANDSHTNEPLSGDATVEGLISISNPMQDAEARNGTNEEESNGVNLNDSKNNDNPVSSENSEVDERNSTDREIHVNPPQQMEAMVDASEITAETTILEDKRHIGVNGTTEALINISNPMKSTMVDAEASSDIKEVPTDASIPKDITETSGEAKKIMESEASRDEDVTLQKPNDDHA